MLSTGQLVTEEFYALGKLVRLGMGLRHYDGNTTLCMASAVAGYKLSFGTDGPPGCYEDLELADVVVLWGANVADNHPLLAPRMLGPDRPTIVVVDPRVTKTAALADVHLAVRPRGDVALLNGILRVVLDEGLVDLDAVRGHTEGIDELLAHLEGWTVERAAEESGIEPEAIRSVARLIGRAERCVLAWTMGVNHSVQGTETVTLLNSLAVLTGNIGRPGAAPFSITGQCNAMGTREAGFTASMPGYRAYDDPAARARAGRAVGGARGPPARRAGPGLPRHHQRRRLRDGSRACGSSPPTRSSPTPTGRCSSTRSGASTCSSCRTATRRRPPSWPTWCCPPPCGARRTARSPTASGGCPGCGPRSSRRARPAPTSTSSCSLARRWGCADELFEGWEGPEDAFAEWSRVSAGRPCDYSGITWERIDQAGGVQWPCPEGDETVPLAGTARLYADHRFNRPDGRAKLHPVEPVPLRDPPRPAYPLLLNTGRTVEHWHTRTKTGRIAILEGLSPEAWIELHPADAAPLGIRAGDWVRVTSSRGSVERIRARVTPIVRAGEVFIPFHWEDRCANRLTDDEFDPISREPNYKQCAVRVEPAGR